MPNATFQHECTKCGKLYESSSSWISPELYSDPDKAIKTHAFWCPNRSCEKGQSVVLQMLPDGNVTVVEVIDFSSLVRDDSPSYYTNNKDKTAQKLTEDVAMSVIGKLTSN